MKKLFSILFLMISTHALANSICMRSQDDVVANLRLQSSRLSFHNQGGLFGGGVCWWHSRLQRSSAYLTSFRPELAPPTPAKLSKILHSLKSMDSVVEIPGFHDFYSFSMKYRKEIQKMLDQWQVQDGVVNGEWIRGISGYSHLSVDGMKNRMESVFKQFMDTAHPMWVMAQIKGIESHSFLVLEMEPTNDGFEMDLIDSNYPKINKTITYKYGQKFLKHHMDDYSYVPYTGFQKDYQSIFKTLSKHCGHRNEFVMGQGMNGDIELHKSFR